MTTDVEFGPREHGVAGRLVSAGLEEDLAEGGDRTSEALFDDTRRGSAALVARAQGVVAGLPVAETVFASLDGSTHWQAQVGDGAAVRPGEHLATIEGAVRTLLAGERLALNFVSHLSGVASLTRQYVDAVHGTKALICDTRKTLPGWRVLQKYAVRAGGGCNHRMSLGDAVLIKDNHLAEWGQQRRLAASANASSVVVEAVRRVQETISEEIPVIVEVESIEQLEAVLPLAPDVVLLDNMDAAMLREAVRRRDAAAPEVLLEASGGITLENVRTLAESGVDRISIGALTHSAPALDVAMDWAL